MLQFEKIPSNFVVVINSKVFKNEPIMLIYFKMKLKLMNSGMDDCNTIIPQIDPNSRKRQLLTKFHQNSSFIQNT